MLYFPAVIESIREILHNKVSLDREHAAVRSTIISACCGPNVNLQELSQLLGIYENRNFHKLAVFKERREAYIGGRTSNMNGERYASAHYGFPPEVMQFLREWFIDDDCSVPDRWSRKVFHVNKNGIKTRAIVRHMRVLDRIKGHERFVKLRGKECLKLCSESLLRAGRKMIPRIPGRTVLESCRPSFVKYFKKTEFGDCSLCKPSSDNYTVFVDAVRELNHTIKLPPTVSLFVRSKVCSLTLGDRRHECEENRCKHCSLINYFVQDPDKLTSKTLRYSNDTTFEKDYKLQFL